MAHDQPLVASTSPVQPPLAASVLDSCPLCRSFVAAAARRCSSCGADLTPYLEISSRGEAYTRMALELLLRGEAAAARGIIEQLGLWATLPAPRRSELLARLALAEGDWAAAAQQLAGCTPETAQQLEAQLQLQAGAAHASRELYNLALATARRGAITSAARLLARAVAADPGHGAAWQLKLKADLLAGDIAGCYDDLASLDRLSLRPAQFHDLERLLPPVY
jgi:hypothetical protein